MSHYGHRSIRPANAQFASRGNKIDYQRMYHTDPRSILSMRDIVQRQRFL